MSNRDASCPCGHGEDDICLNGVIYGSCGDECCGGSCVDVDQCLSLPGCCDGRNNMMGVAHTEPVNEGSGAQAPR